MTKLADAINLYNPNAQWVIDGDDYDSLQWHSQDIPKPTLKELKDLLPLVEAAKEKVAQETAAKKQALLDKLGITEAEAKILIG